MARHRHPEPLTGLVMALLGACVLSALPTHAQDDPPPAVPLVLNPQAVSKLLKKDEPPDYPPLAKLNYIQGSVRLRVLVACDGKVSEAHVIQGHPFLAASALQAVRSWIYRPYRVGIRAVAFSTLVDFHFVLRSKVLGALPPAAEKDLRARITPPEVENQLPDPPADDHVRLRVLVDSEGHALDAQLIEGSASKVREAEKAVSHWTFRPARWGALPVPWYLDIDVPVTHTPA